MGPRDCNVYPGLRAQISAALQGALLTQRNLELYREAVVARQAAEEANQLKSRFLSTVGHELRTPLTLIVGTLEMMLQHRSADAARSPTSWLHDIECVHGSARHLSRLIGDVLDLARSQAGELRLVRQPLDLRAVLADVAVLARPLVEEKGLAWRFDMPESLPFVSGDRTRLHQVVLNLVSNSAKFTDRGEVALTVALGQDEVTVSVSDTGLGIPVEDQATIFDEFHQSQRTMQRGYGGMGLGLAISRHLVELHGGRLGVRSAGARGDGFDFLLRTPHTAGRDDAAGYTRLA